MDAKLSVIPLLINPLSVVQDDKEAWYPKGQRHDKGVVILKEGYVLQIVEIEEKISFIFFVKNLGTCVFTTIYD